MTPPSESSSGHIDMFRVREKPPELPDRSFPAVYVVPRYSVPRYHSMQLALVIGLFACGGLVCSTFLVVENDEFLGPRYWPRKSYSSPALATPQRPVSAPTVPQNGQFKSNDEEKTTALQERRVGDRKTSTSPLSLASAIKIPYCAAKSLTDEAGESRLKFLSPPDNLRYRAVSCAQFPAWVAPASL
jgi:hypothetical protein